MTSDWPEQRLGDLLEVRHGWPFRGELFSEVLTGQPIVVNIGNFRYEGGFRFESTTVREYRGEYPSEYELDAGDILVVMTCQTAGGEILGIPARVPDDGRTYLHNQRLGKLRLRRTDSLDRDFLYWLFLSPRFNRELYLSASGTKILHTSPSRIEQLRLPIPGLAEQRAIARILGALDDKIELNRRISDTLEAMARALFKSWFVDFDPVRAKAEGRGSSLPEPLADLFPAHLVGSEVGEIPEGWLVGSVYEIADVIYGAPFSSSRFNAEGIGEPLIRIRDLPTESPGVWTSEKHPKGYKVRPGDIVVGMDGEFRAYLWGGAEAWLNQRLCVFDPKSRWSAAFVRNAIMQPLADVEASETATTVIHLGKADIDRFRVVIPTPGVADHFTAASQPWYDRIISAKQVSRTLTSLRDTLLPKLISGELRIPDAERIVGEVA